MPAADVEIFLTIEHATAEIEVSSTPADENGDLPQTVDKNSSGAETNWDADTNCDSAGIGAIDFDCNTVYKIDFDVQGSSNDLVFQYFFCENDDPEDGYDASSQGFYCIDEGSHSANDIEFTYTSSGEWKIEIQGVWDPDTASWTNDVSDELDFSQDWVFPWDYDMWCDSNSTCESNMLDIGYFIAPHWDTSNYVSGANEIVIPSGDYTWGGVSFDVSNVPTVEVNGDLSILDFELSSTDVNDYVLEVTGGGWAEVKNSTIENKNYRAVLVSGSARDIEIQNSTIQSHNTEFAITALSSSEVYLYPEGDGFNTIKGKGIISEGGASIYGGSTVAYTGEQNFCRQSGSLHLRASGTNSYVNGQYSYYVGGNNPYVDEVSGGDVVYTNLGTATCGSYKGNINPPVTLEGGSSEYFEDELLKSAYSGDIDGLIGSLSDPAHAKEMITSERIMTVIRYALKKARHRKGDGQLLQLAEQYESDKYPYDLLQAQYLSLVSDYTSARMLLEDLITSGRYSSAADHIYSELLNLYRYHAFTTTVSLSPSSIEHLTYTVDYYASEMGSLSDSNSSNQGKAGKTGGRNSDEADTSPLEIYPNPFNPQTSIAIRLEKMTNVELSVVNTLGQRVWHMQKGELNSGNHVFSFDGDLLPSGAYYLRAVIGETVETRTLLLLK